MVNLWQMSVRYWRQKRRGSPSHWKVRARVCVIGLLFLLSHMSSFACVIHLFSCVRKIEKFTVCSRKKKVAVEVFFFVSFFCAVATLCCISPKVFLLSPLFSSESFFFSHICRCSILKKKPPPALLGGFKRRAISTH